MTGNSIVLTNNNRNQVEYQFLYSRTADMFLLYPIEKASRLAENPHGNFGFPSSKYESHTF